MQFRDWVGLMSTYGIETLIIILVNKEQYHELLVLYLFVIFLAALIWARGFCIKRWGQKRAEIEAKVTVLGGQMMALMAASIPVLVKAILEEKLYKVGIAAAMLGYFPVLILFFSIYHYYRKVLEHIDSFNAKTERNENNEYKSN